MNRILKTGTFFVLMCLLNLKVVHSQTSIRGIYVGYEQNPFCYDNSCRIDHPEKYKLIKNKLYYKVILNFTDSSILITKTPVKFTDDKLNHELIDSTAGGYYSYKAKYSKYKGYINGYLIDCKYCYKSATAVMRYVDANYKFTKKSKDLILSNDTEKNILFKKRE